MAREVIDFFDDVEKCLGPFGLIGDTAGSFVGGTD